MIQRIQSIYLLVALLLVVACFFVPAWSGEVVNPITSKAESMVITAGYPMVGYGIASLVLGALSVLACATAISQFKNRGLQLKISFVCIGLTLGFMICLYLQTTTLTNAMGRNGQGIILSCLAPVLCFLAARAINSDEKLVRSADRLR